MHTDSRLTLIRAWLSQDLALDPFTIEVASADASFRRYFRVTTADGTRIVMDAPPDKEDIAPFLKVQGLLAGCGVHVPAVLAADLPRGLLLLEDLGNTPLLSTLQAGADPGPLYSSALQALAQIQLTGAQAATQLAPYDAPVLRRELQLMPEWFCHTHLQLTLSPPERAMLAATEAFLVDEALAQPQVLVHRDYHSRNLMVTATHSPGIIDFQDALQGPAAYDLVSILKDCYISWPREQVEAWVAEFRALLLAAGSAGELLAGRSQAQYLRWFDLIGLQRHIKVLGIFARLFWRDGKAGYLNDLPLTLAYVRDTASRFPELADFSRFVDTRLAPHLAAAHQRATQSTSS